jgi:hypothetical protein
MRLPNRAPFGSRRGLDLAAISHSRLATDAMLFLLTFQSLTLRDLLDLLARADPASESPASQ